MTGYTVFASDELPIDEEARWQITVDAWAPFMLEDPISNRLWDRMMSEYTPFQFSIFEGETMIAAGNSIPVVWDGGDLPDGGWDWALESAFEAQAAGIKPNILCAISVTIARSHVGKGVSRAAVEAMRGIARKHGFDKLIAPVRPNQKHLYPLVPMERYITWTHTDGEAPFDAWLRTHWRAGARIVKVAPESMVIRGTVAEWEGWASMRFPESGSYVVPAALNPVTIDRERDLGVYVEPNVWMLHTL